MARYYVPLRGSVSPEVLDALLEAGLAPTGASHRLDERNGFGAWVEARDADEASARAVAAIRGLPLGLDGEVHVPSG